MHIIKYARQKPFRTMNAETLAAVFGAKGNIDQMFKCTFDGSDCAGVG